MDAVEFCKQLDRICKSNFSCESCLLGNGKCAIRYIGRNGKSVVKEVEQWAKENPAKTRMTQFLKKFPDADEEKIRHLHPCVLDMTMLSMECAKNSRFEADTRCYECCEKYWSEEIEK